MRCSRLVVTFALLQVFVCRTGLSADPADSYASRPWGISLSDLFPVSSGDWSLDGALVLPDERRDWSLVGAFGYESYRNEPGGGWQANGL